MMSSEKFWEKFRELAEYEEKRTKARKREGVRYENRSKF